MRLPFNDDRLMLCHVVPASHMNRGWATHGAETHYVFGTQRGGDGLGPPNNYTYCPFTAPGELQLARTMGAYWSALARSGDPNDGCTMVEGECIHWPQIGSSKGGLISQILVAGVSDGRGNLGPQRDMYVDNCGFWGNLFEYT